MPNERIKQHVTVLLGYLKDQNNNRNQNIRVGKKMTQKIKPGKTVRYEELNNNEDEIGKIKKTQKIL